MQKAVDEKNAGALFYNSVVAVVGLIPDVGPAIDLILAAGSILVSIINANTTSLYTSALANAALWHNIDCAIYIAIAVDGYVTDANFATVRANINAVSYPDPAVKSAILAYVDALGARGFETAQMLGAVYVGDCSSCCPGDWTFTWDLRVARAGWTDNGAGWTAGVGYTATNTATYGGGVAMNPYVGGFASTYCVSINVQYTATAPDTVFGRHGAVAVYYPGTSQDCSGGSGAISDTLVFGRVCTEFDLSLSTHNGSIAASGALSIQQATFRGRGVCPFGTPVCIP